MVVETAVSQDELGVSGDEYDTSSKEAFEKFVADVKVFLFFLKIELDLKKDMPHTNYSCISHESHHLSKFNRITTRRCLLIRQRYQVRK